MKKKLTFFFAPWFMGALFLIFAAAMGVATFIEKDYGTSVARKLVYNAWWFEMLLLLLVINLLGQVFKYKLFKTKKITILFFHLAFVVMVVGAGITRYFGFEGSIHIREGQTQNICQTYDKYVQFKIKDKSWKDLYKSQEKVLVTNVAFDNFNKKIKIDGIDYHLKLEKYIPNTIEKVVADPNGRPLVSLILSREVTGKSENIILTEDEVYESNSIKIGFNSLDSTDIRISFEIDSFYISAVDMISEISMLTRAATVYPANRRLKLSPMKIYDYKGMRIVVKELHESGISLPVSLPYHSGQTGRDVLQFDLKYGKNEAKLFVREGDIVPVRYNAGIHLIELSYGSVTFKIPFHLKLNDFILERYPGSNSPSSYKSKVLLLDAENGITRNEEIYMNHILKYRGYRFYQSSYDKDEMGTILSVNNDYAGMLVTYTGYFFLFLFIILSLGNKNSIFRKINKNFWNNSSVRTIFLILFLSISQFSFGSEELTSIDKKSANVFGEILVQDQKGRTKPLSTLSNDILRKISRQTDYNGYSAMQVFLGLYYDFDHWMHEPLIKVSNAEVKRLIGIHENYISFSDVVDFESNSYILGKYVDAVYAKIPGARNKFDKEIMKLDERINICYMISQGEFLKIFPLNDGTKMWGNSDEALVYARDRMDSLYVKNVLNMYYSAIIKGSFDGNYEKAEKFLTSIKDYQKKYSRYDLPNEVKIQSETFYYKAKIFKSLVSYYALLGVLLLIILITQIIRGDGKGSGLIKIINVLLFIGLLAHTFGLALRWYISGHAPMSNGYESMIYVSWVAVLAGFLFIKKSKFALVDTSILASLTLMVAHLNFMDPEITNLVPVLKSYWLSFHVSVITGSYAFLGEGAIGGLIVLILYILSNKENRKRIDDAIKELSVLNYQRLTVGLFLLTIGTFLGAIWANESWGRYWGWDPKETWALITLIVYSFVIHSKMMLIFNNVYIFNFLSLFAFFFVLMTYFGVNYFLSGLHSYAGGDRIQIPVFVYIAVGSLVVISIVAYRKYAKNFYSLNL